MTIPGLRIEPDSAVPVYRQIADGIRLALQEGRVRPGHRLPPTRSLARLLGVNRNTVVAAYDALAAEGVVASHTGRGTFLLDPAGPVPAPPDSDRWIPAFSRAVDADRTGGLLAMYRQATSSEGISFAGSYPAGDLMPTEAFRRAVNEVIRERGGEVLSYGPTAGDPHLREAIAAAMRERGSSVATESILVTNGSQQALELVFRAFLDPGDVIVLEDPTYTGALSALGALGARRIGIPVDEEGIRPDQLAHALERHRPRLVYLQPTFQNPTTAVLGEGRRREILDIAARFRVPVVEDDWAGDLRLEGAELPTLHALDAGRQVVYVSTFSKKLLPGLRVGWVAAPPAVMDRLVLLKQVADCGTSPLLQAALHAFLREGGLGEHLRRVRPVYRERRDVMLGALERHLAGQASWSRPEGGLFTWVRLAGGVDTTELSQAARARGVLVSRGELFHVDGGGRDALRLTYAAVPPGGIEAGVAILGELVRERRPGTEARREHEAVPIL